MSNSLTGTYGQTIKTVQSEPEKALPSILNKPVLVPIKIDAYLNYDQRQVVSTDPRQRAYLAPINTPNYDSLKLDGDLVQHDIFEHSRDPPFMSHADRGRTQASKQGIYLHWGLPKLYRKGVVASSTAQDGLKDLLKRSGYPSGDLDNLHVDAGMPIFRSVPERWLVSRVVGPSQAKINDVEYREDFIHEDNRMLQAMEDDGLKDSAHYALRLRLRDGEHTTNLNTAVAACKVRINMPDGISTDYGDSKTEHYDLFVVESVRHTRHSLPSMPTCDEV